MIEFKLPDIGEGIAEGEIVKWLVAEGDAVEEHQPVAEVMTDKATVEVPAPAAGTIVGILAKEGETVPVGQVIFRLDQRGGAPSAKPRPAEKPAAKPVQSAAPSAAPKPAPRAEAASGARTLEFKLPDIGEGIAEGEIVRWLVAEGDAVEEHQPVVEVMTDKATVEVPAPAAGTIAKLAAKEGATVPVGSVIFHLRTAGAATPEREQAPARAEPARELVGAGARTAAPARTSAGGGKTDGRVLAVPSARRVARELDIELSEVEGSGRNGVIRRADVEAFARTREAAPAKSAAPAKAAAAGRAAQPPVSVPAGERSEQRIPFRGVRRKIAEAMVRSAFTAPHFTVVEEVDVTELVRLRLQAKALGEEQGVKVTYMPFIMKATALALARYPMLNARLDEEAQELVRFGYVDLGIATDTEQGLIVPVIRDVQAKGVLRLAQELAELAERTRTGKAKPEELRGSTFSITNAGNIGGIFATPIINFPDVAILGVHRIVKRPGVVETPEGERIEVRQYMHFSCSVDHRLADGADGARFLVHLKRLLESPGLLAL